MASGPLAPGKGHATDTRPQPESELPEGVSPELAAARASLESARERLLSAALAFCDGTISAGQLRAVRELLREKEVHVSNLEGETPAIFVEEEPGVTPKSDVDMISAEGLAESEVDQIIAPDAPELKNMLQALEQKMTRLEDDFQHGRINASQYRAIRRHYEEQREVAVRLKQAHPKSDRWRVVLEEGRTSFLMQLNEAVCRCIALFDMDSRERIFLQGEMPKSAEEAMGLLRTFGPSGDQGAEGRMLATHTDDGSALLLIPGNFTAALAVFSQDPPGWQVRALREVHLNFEAANRVHLRKKDHDALVFPDLNRFVRT